MHSHRVDEFIHGMAAKLASRSRHVSVFLAAGASKACGLPDIAGLEAAIAGSLEHPDSKVFKAQLKGRNLETVLSRLRRIAALVEGGETVDGLTSGAASALDRAICTHLVAQLDSRSAQIEPYLRLAGWAAQAEYARPLEIFTVNYDLLIETALEQYGVPYFDGFVGALKARFRTELVEGGIDDPSSWIPRFFVRVWKLHGSINWTWADGESSEIVRIGAPAPNDAASAIYPSDAKYDESRRVPFVVLQDRFRRSLLEPESLTIVSGYSWGDEHLNEMLIDAARRRPRSEILAFSYSSIPEVLEQRATEIPNLQAIGRDKAIIGGREAPWSDTGTELLPETIWSDGKIRLGDFSNLAAFLATSSSYASSDGLRLADSL